MTGTLVGFPVDIVEKHIRDAIARGQHVTEWQRYTLAAWAHRDPKIPETKKRGNPDGLRYSQARIHNLPDARVLPVLCNCFYCGDGALIFPDEEGVPGQYPQGDGSYCVCPCCTFSDCEHKRESRMRRAVP